MSEHVMAPALGDGRTRRRATVIAVTFVVLIVAALIAVFVLHAAGWSGMIGAIGYQPSTVIAIGRTGARVTVPSDWEGRGSVRAPAWLGFDRSPDNHNNVLLAPLRHDGRELGIDWGSAVPTWDEIAPSSQLVHLDPGSELKAAGVRRIVVESSRSIDRPTSDQAVVYLFVDDPAGRYLISLTVDTPPERVSAALVLSALKQGGFSFR